MSCSVDIEIAQSTECIDLHVVTPCETVELAVKDPVCAGGGAATISPDPNNRLEKRPNGLFVSDTLEPDPLAYYILAKS